MMTGTYRAVARVGSAVLVEASMDALIETLNAKLSQWKPETAAQVRERVTEIISLADQDALDLLRTRAVEQEVLDMLDEPAPR
jgi:hypothetical protein